MLVTSRSFAEYEAMFDLSGVDLTGSILDCCAGGSSFAAESPARVVAVDPVYALAPAALATRVRAAIPHGDRIIDEHPDRFEWGWYGSPANRLRLRTAAAEAFLADLHGRPGRYLAGALPHLPLASGGFDLVLCSHLLFTWSDRLGEDWHRRAIAELIRVARREVRVFPVVVQGTGEPVPFLDALRDGIHAAGHGTQLRGVPYRFQRGAHHMLVITPGRTRRTRPSRRTLR
jgi:hypothetical protein